MHSTLLLHLPYAILSWSCRPSVSPGAELTYFICLPVCECLCVYYLLLTGCRALFTFNQYFVTFGSGHLRKKRGNDNRQQTVSNSLFCVYVYAKYNQTTDRARGTVLPPFPLLTILPTVLASDRDEKRESGWRRYGNAAAAAAAEANQVKIICSQYAHTRTHIYQECVCVCKQLKAASQLAVGRGEGGQTIGRANIIEIGTV